MHFFKKIKHDEYYKYKNETVSIFIPQYGEHVLYRTDIFHCVMDHFKRSGQHNHSVIRTINTPEKFFCRFSSKRLLPNQIIYRLYYEILISTSYNKYVITINKLGNLCGNIEKARKIMKYFINHLRQRAIGRRSRSYITGFVIEEQGQDESYHYHIIITDPNNELTDDFDTFLKQVELTIASLNRNSSVCNNLTSNSLCAIPSNCFDVQTYYKQNLEEYVTKNFEKTDFLKAGDTIGIIAPPNDSHFQDVCFG